MKFEEKSIPYFGLLAGVAGLIWAAVSPCDSGLIVGMCSFGRMVVTGFAAVWITIYTIAMFVTHKINSPGRRLALCLGMTAGTITLLTGVAYILLI